MKVLTAGIIGLVLLFNVVLLAQGKEGQTMTFTPISHASFVMQTSKATVYVDPTGDLNNYAKFPAPNIILITDIHGDHFQPELVKSLRKDRTTVIVPKAVFDKLQTGTILNNGESRKIGDVTVEAIPMYNTTPDRLKYHEKGRGNGYLVTADHQRVYVSGDTEDIKEMRRLKDIDYAFVCMNLPYTMTVEQAASAVLEFKPKVVFPYHYRGTGGFSDVNKFKKLVAVDPSIEVRLLPWYENAK